MLYVPDKWVVIEIKNEEEVFYKILGGWSGGYLDGDSWRLNSGVVEVEKKGENYHFKGDSGSVYICNENSYGMNMIMSEIYQKMKEGEEKYKMTVSLLENQDFEKLKYK